MAQLPGTELDPAQRSRFRDASWQFFVSLAKATLQVGVVALVGTLLWFRYGQSLSMSKKPRLPKDSISVTKPILGSPGARVAVVEYSDFACPFCGSFSQSVLPVLRQKYIDTGLVSLSFRHFPIVQLHPLALSAAVAAECARNEGHFWEMHDVLFAHQHDLGQSAVSEYARSIGIPADTFQACVSDQRVEDAVQRQVKEADSLAIYSTPTFFLGRVLADGRVSITTRIDGLPGLARIEGLLDALVDSSQKR
jgi:protein-disulfide isomerase